jgi:hypothetical protein
VGTNLDYARTLLFQLEQESIGIKAQQQRKQNLQADLADKKDLVSRLNERLYQLNEIDDEEEPVDGEGGGGEELLGEDDVWGDIIEPNGEDVVARQADSKEANNISSLETSLDRRRKPSWSSENDTQPRNNTRHSTSTSDASTLFRRPRAPGGDSNEKDVGTTTSSDINPNLPQTEKLLSHNRMEQEDLTASLLSMAQALKASSQAFASSLESEKEILDRASEGLEKNTAGMQAAEKRMGALRRMTEGRGWLGRMLMYAWIMGLMMIALIIVGFLPKLRF